MKEVVIKTNEKYTEEWIRSAKLALNWFIKVMGLDEWHDRRSKVVKYFNDIQESQFPRENPAGGQVSEKEQLQKPYAIYDDWIAWYMYLVESLVDRPGCDEPMQSARIYPVFAAIGRRLDLAKGIGGVEDRLKELVGSRRNQADSTLYELVVAICYRRNGWEVQFIPEAPPEKRPDFVVNRGDEKYFVECKRLAKVTEYSEKERQAWLGRWQHLLAYMQHNRPATMVDIIFKVPVDEVAEYEIVSAFALTVRQTPNERHHFVETKQFAMQIQSMDLQKINAHFKDNLVRNPSPQFIALLADGYESSGSYTTAFVPTEVKAFGPEDGEHTLNIFIGGLKTAYCGKWECIADDSIEKKAKDVKTHLSRAISQIPDDVPGIVHIGFETLHGPAVEFRRQAKIIETIGQFDYGAKLIKVVFCNALQPESGIETFDFAETTSYFSNGPDPMQILPASLLMDAPGTPVSDSTHWREDLDRLMVDED